MTKFFRFIWYLVVLGNNFLNNYLDTEASGDDFTEKKGLAIFM